MKIRIILQGKKAYALCDQVQKPMYGIVRKIRFYYLPFDCQFDLFNKVVTPECEMQNMYTSPGLLIY